MLSLSRSVAHASLAHALEHKTWNRRSDLGKNRAPVWGRRESTGENSGFGVGFGTAKDKKSPSFMEITEEPFEAPRCSAIYTVSCLCVTYIGGRVTKSLTVFSDDLFDCRVDPHLAENIKGKAGPHLLSRTWPPE